MSKVNMRTLHPPRGGERQCDVREHSNRKALGYVQRDSLFDIL